MVYRSQSRECWAKSYWMCEVGLFCPFVHFFSRVFEATDFARPMGYICQGHLAMMCNGHWVMMLRGLWVGLAQGAMSHICYVWSSKYDLGQFESDSRQILPKELLVDRNLHEFIAGVGLMAPYGNNVESSGFLGCYRYRFASTEARSGKDVLKNTYRGETLQSPGVSTYPIKAIDGYAFVNEFGKEVSIRKGLVA